MDSATTNAADGWRRIRLRHRLMIGLWLGACPFWAIDILILGHAFGVSAAFFLMLAYVCAFIGVTGMYVFTPCPMCGDPIRYRPGARGGGPLSIRCLHCGASPS